MKYSDLTQFDKTLTPIVGEEFDFVSPTNFEFPKAGGFVFLKDVKFLRKLEELMEKSDFSEMAVIIEKAFVQKIDSEKLEFLKSKFKAIFSTDSVPLSMSFLSKPFYDEKFQELNDMVDGRQMGTATIHPTSWIAQGAFIGEGVKVGPNVKIHCGAKIMSYSEIEEGSEIYPGVTLYPFVKVGKNCRIHSGTVIGADGFGYNFDQGVHHKVWHMGSVVIEDNVEIGANSCVDQGTFSPTIIGAGTKIDNQVQVGHNCRIGKGVIMCGHVAVGGSATVGDFTVFGGKSAAADGITIGMACQIAGAAMVTSSIEAKSVVAGHPARPLKEWMKGVAYVRKHSLSK